MIASLSGTVLAKDTNSLIISAAGIGFKVEMTPTALASLPSVGEEANIFTYMHVKEDGMSLFGFVSQDERETFEKLISVSGVGPKIGLAALSALSAKEIARAIALDDVKTLSKVPGLGKKTAQRLILELKTAFPAQIEIATGADVPSVVSEDAAAIQALVSMGFCSAEIQRALQGCDVPVEDTQGVIRYALKHLM
jgi:holliday junction DNA helicase RuvA